MPMSTNCGLAQARPSPTSLCTPYFSTQQHRATHFLCVVCPSTPVYLSIGMVFVQHRACAPLPLPN